MLLQVTDLRVTYGRVEAVRGVSLNVDEGEVVGMIGANGAGKSSTLAAITGSVAATGDVQLDGRPLLGRRTEDIARLGVALVPEGRHIFGTMSVEENLRLGLTARPRRLRGSARADLDAVLDRFEVLRRLYGASAAHLSGGEQQQLAIARALLSRPRLLVLDEPSLGLAPKLVDGIFSLIGELRDERTTVLLVEQNAQRVIAFADRTYLLRRGLVAHHGDAASFRDTVDVKGAYLGLETTA